eukprot:gnl/MRDRNA2_/MRDRNA2_130820_c0_seq1.p1 gnl/MRDRNA2_/MRDRNA2_130820_c0~~gnl/MRDRNA2_/MRDRNA2_130820_c0_seq1.p1  ORF type:complete len:347 (+),score=49.69 gnl/MRDRNA2_/MRDRNA2_130820_c0_seq1:118-1158(+)
MSPTAILGGLILLETFGQTSIMAVQKSGLHFELMTITFLSECVKFVVALLSCAVNAPASPTSNKFSRHRFFQFAIPAVLYMVINNGHFHLLYFLPQTELFMLWNCKILWTAFWLRCLVGRDVSKRQLAALVVLAVGVVLQGLHETEEKESRVLYTGRASHLFGVTAALMGCSLASLTNVIDEMLMKQRPNDSLMFQNLHIYFWGILVNGLCLVLRSRDEKSPLHDGFFNGYTPWTLLIVVFMSSTGLFISAVMKFIDNIAVVHAHAASMITVLGISVLLFDERLSVATWIGAAIITAATIWYAHEGLPEATACRKDTGQLAHASTPVIDSEAGGYGAVHDKVQQQA